MNSARISTDRCLSLFFLQLPVAGAVPELSRKCPGASLSPNLTTNPFWQPELDNRRTFLKPSKFVTGT